MNFTSFISILETRAPEVETQLFASLFVSLSNRGENRCPCRWPPHFKPNQTLNTRRKTTNFNSETEISIVTQAKYKIDKKKYYFCKKSMVCQFCLQFGWLRNTSPPGHTGHRSQFPDIDNNMSALAAAANLIQPRVQRTRCWAMTLAAAADAGFGSAPETKISAVREQ